jgi:hypothetical protein
VMAITPVVIPAIRTGILAAFLDIFVWH